MKKTTVYLVDLFHEAVSVKDTVPLHLGYLASTADELYGDRFEVKIFKYSERLLEALKEKKPDIVGFTNYTWNLQIQQHFAKVVKQMYDAPPLTIMGGPNIRSTETEFKEFLNRHTYIDIYIPYEGETPFGNLLAKFPLENEFRGIETFYADIGPIDGCYMDVDGYEFTKLNPSDSKALSYGSPYVKGIMDQFIKDPRLTPLFETNRNCPYSCTFCVWGQSESKLTFRDLDLILSEFYYVATNSANQPNWFFADANMGVGRDYIDIVKTLVELKESHSVPRSITVNWAKNSSKKILHLVNILKDLILQFQISLQSTDTEVLKHVKRVNLQPHQQKELIDACHEAGTVVYTDLLVGCSNETLESHYDTIRDAFDRHFDCLNINNIRMLPGTEMDTAEDREKYGFKTKFRLIPNSYGYYNDEFVFEIEEGIRASNTLSEDEMNSLKVTHFLVYILWNSGYARTLLKMGLDHGVSVLDVILSIQNPEKNTYYKPYFEQLHLEAIAEWFDTEEKLKEFYAKPENYEPLLGGDQTVEKLIWKYFSIFLTDINALQNLISDVSDELIKRNVDSVLIKTTETITIERIVLDFFNSECASKTITLSSTEAVFGELMERQILPSSTEFKNGTFQVKYGYNLSHFQDMKDFLEKHKHRECPITAYSAALSNFSQAAFTYSIVA